MRPQSTTRAGRLPDRETVLPGRSLSESRCQRLTLAAMCVATFMIQVEVKCLS